jgi:hypothetical protein
MAKELDGMMKKLMAQSKREWQVMDNKRSEDRLKEAQAAKQKELEIEKLNAGSPTKEKIVVTMNDVQIQNWRKILALQIGPYALIMPREEIQKIRNTMQGQVYELDKQLKEGEEP